MSKRHFLGVIGNVRRNSTTLISTNLSGLRLITSQYLKLVDRTDSLKSFLVVFPRYVELPMLEKHVIRFIGNKIRNPTTPISTNMLGLRVIPSQFLKIVDWTDCHKLF